MERKLSEIKFEKYSKTNKFPQCFKECPTHSFEKLDQILLNDISGCVIQCTTCCKEQRIISDNLVSINVICGSLDNFFIPSWPKFESTTQNAIEQTLLSNSGNSQKYQTKVEVFIKGFRQNILHFIQQFEDDMMKKAKRFDQQYEIIVEQYMSMTQKKELKSIIFDENYPDINSKSVAMKKILKQVNANTQNNEKQILNIFEEFKQSSIFNESDLLEQSMEKLLDSIFHSYDKVVKQNSAWMHQKRKSMPVELEQLKKSEIQKQMDNNLSNPQKQDEQLNFDMSNKRLLVSNNRPLPNNNQMKYEQNNYENGLISPRNPSTSMHYQQPNQQQLNHSYSYGNEVIEKNLVNPQQKNAQALNNMINPQNQKPISNDCYPIQGTPSRQRQFGEKRY